MQDQTNNRGTQDCGKPEDAASLGSDDPFSFPEVIVEPETDAPTSFPETPVESETLEDSKRKTTATKKPRHSSPKKLSN